MQSLPFANCHMNLEYIISKNHEVGAYFVTNYCIYDFSMYIF